MNKKNLQSIMQREARELYGECENHYMLIGHLHHVDYKDSDGVIIMTLPSPTVVDEWHNKEGYLSSWKGFHCFMVGETEGITEVWHIKTT